MEANMKSVLLAVLIMLVARPAQAATDVWVFYGAGPPIFSSGMNQIARKASVISGVGHVHGPYRYYETQRAYDEMRAALSNHTADRVVAVGYSCGGNASLAIGQSGIPVYLILLQPSLWCGYYLPTTPNVVYVQDTYGGCIETLGLGCLKTWGRAQNALNIFRPANHLRADTDPDYQHDALAAINCIANPSRCEQRGRGQRSNELTLMPGQTTFGRRR